MTPKSNKIWARHLQICAWSFFIVGCGGGGGHGAGSSAADTTPDLFVFTPQDNAASSVIAVSNTVIIRSINAAASISVVNGEYSIGCDSTGFRSSASTISDGQSVCVRHNTAPTPLTTVSTTLNVGSQSAVFRSTTAASDTTPDSFSFSTKLDVTPSTVVISDAVTVTGINTSAPISVSGGEYSIGCSSSFTSGASLISNGQTLCVRHISASAPTTTTTTGLSIGGVSASFSSTTASKEFLLPYYNGDGNIYGYRASTRQSILLDSAVPDDPLIGMTFWPHILMSARINPISGAVSQFHQSLLVYVKNGLLYRVSLAAGTTPMPVRVSGHTDLCGVARLLTDYETPENSWVVLRRAADSGGSCSNLPMRATLVRASASESDLGVRLEYNSGENTAFVAIHTASGGIASILGAEGVVPNRKLRRYSADFSASSDLMSVNDAFFGLDGHELWTRGAYLGVLENVSGDAQVVRYDEARKAAYVVYEPNTGLSSSIAFDQNNVYLPDQNQLIRISHAATSTLLSSTVVTSLPNASGMVGISRVMLSGSNVALNAYDAGSGAAGAGGYIVPANAFIGSATKVFGAAGFFFASSGNLLLVNFIDFAAGGTKSSGVYTSDGTLVSTRPLSFWLGRAVSSAFQVTSAGVDPDMFYSASPAPSAHFALSDIGVDRQTIRAVNPVDAGVGLQLGQVPDERAVLTVTGFEDAGLVGIEIPGASLTQNCSGMTFLETDSLGGCVNSAVGPNLPFR